MMAWFSDTREKENNGTSWFICLYSFRGKCLRGSPNFVHYFMSFEFWKCKLNMDRQQTCPVSRLESKTILVGWEKEIKLLWLFLVCFELFSQLQFVSHLTWFFCLNPSPLVCFIKNITNFLCTTTHVMFMHYQMNQIQNSNVCHKVCLFIGLNIMQN